jgi:phytoene dehydrogenase-like protein
MKTSARTLGKHAIVIGSGIAGMLAARVLSEFFERVTVLERF